MPSQGSPGSASAGDSSRRPISLGWEEPLEKEMATHSSILVWRIPWTEEPGGLQSMGSQRVRHDSASEHTHTQCHRDAEQALPLVGLISIHSDQSLWSFKKEKVRSLKQWVSTLPMKTPNVISSQV